MHERYINMKEFLRKVLSRIYMVHASGKTNQFEPTEIIHDFNERRFYVFYYLKMTCIISGWLCTKSRPGRRVEIRLCHHYQLPITQH